MPKLGVLKLFLVCKNMLLLHILIAYTVLKHVKKNFLLIGWAFSITFLCLGRNPNLQAMKLFKTFYQTASAVVKTLAMKLFDTFYQTARLLLVEKNIKPTVLFSQTEWQNTESPPDISQ